MIFAPMYGKRIKFWEPISNKYWVGVVVVVKRDCFTVKCGTRKFCVDVMDKWSLL